MEILIVGILVLVAYLLLVMQFQVNEFINSQKAIDYPFYTKEDIKLSKFRMELSKSTFEERGNELDEYISKHKEEIGKVKKNINHSEEFKRIMYLYHSSRDDFNRKSGEYNEMREANYAICSGTKTFEQVADKIFNEALTITKRTSGQNSYDKWLNYQHSNKR